VTQSGALFLIWAVANARQPLIPGVPMMYDKEIPDRFGQDFRLEYAPEGKGGFLANWYTLRRL
jgi:hypothetical protein